MFALRVTASTNFAQPTEMIEQRTSPFNKGRRLCTSVQSSLFSQGTETPVAGQPISIRSRIHGAGRKRYFYRCANIIDTPGVGKQTTLLFQYRWHRNRDFSRASCHRRPLPRPFGRDGPPLSHFAILFIRLVMTSGSACICWQLCFVTSFAIMLCF